MKKFLICLLLFIVCIKIYGQNPHVLIHPCNLAVDPMESLLLVNFEEDPDSVYIGFEPQKFNDTINGKGYLIIAWRIDGKVDVYHEKGLSLDTSKYSIAGKGLAHMIMTEFENSLLEFNENGVNAHFTFTDMFNREIIIRIAEHNSRKRKPFGLLAPMGDAVENPTTMPLIFLQDFYFVRRKNSEILLSIDNRIHNTDNLPLPIDGSKMTFIRYSPSPIITTFNHAFSGALHQHELNENQEVIFTENQELHVTWINNEAYVTFIVVQNATHPVQIIFNDAFPNIANIKNDSDYSGAFSIQAHPSSGKIQGIYTITKKENIIYVTVIPSKGWVPKRTKLSLSFLYTVVHTFKQWPSTYKWSANLYSQEGAYFMESNWKRIK